MEGNQSGINNDSRDDRLKNSYGNGLPPHTAKFGNTELIADRKGDKAQRCVRENLKCFNV